MGEKLGQHFLKSDKKLKEIVSFLNLEDGDIVVEIGPGHGELTSKILEDVKEKRLKNIKLVLLERDPKMIVFLKDKFGSDFAEIFEGNALDLLPEVVKKKIGREGYKLIGNIPYYITGHLFRIVGEMKNKPEVLIFTIQKEVAERICAKDGHSNLISLSVKFWADPKIVGIIKRGEFSPPPKVDSAMIFLKTKGSFDEKLSEKYYKMLKIIFKQPRKTIVNNMILSGIKKEDALALVLGLGLKENSRPCEFNVEKIMRLYS